MPAPKKNQFWKLRSSHGRDKEFASADDLWTEACNYFHWCDSNDLVEERILNSGKRRKARHPRAYTIKALCFFLGIGERTWNDYQKREDFLRVTEAISQVIFTQKFEGAAVGFFNANLISRDLGLVDKTSIAPEDLNDDQLEKLFQKIIDKE